MRRPVSIYIDVEEISFRPKDTCQAHEGTDAFEAAVDGEEIESETYVDGRQIVERA